MIAKYGLTLWPAYWRWQSSFGNPPHAAWLRPARVQRETARQVLHPVLGRLENPGNHFARNLLIGLNRALTFKIQRFASPTMGEQGSPIRRRSSHMKTFHNSKTEREE